MPASSDHPVIILVQPQLGENIGMCARAMLNCGLERMRLVNPRDGWPNEKAVAASADAEAVISGAEVFDSVADAVADYKAPRLQPDHDRLVRGTRGSQIKESLTYKHV